MNIEEIKAMMTNFSDEEVSELFESFKQENVKRSNLDTPKGELMIYSELWKRMYPDENIQEDATWSTTQLGENSIIRSIEKSILTICDYLTGNFTVIINAEKNDALIPRRCKDISHKRKDSYISLNNDILDLISKHAKPNIHKEIFEEALESYNRVKEENKLPEPKSMSYDEFASNHYKFENVIFEYRYEVEHALEELKKVLKKHGKVSVFDLYDISGLKISPSDRYYGWTDLKGVDVISNGDGWIIDLKQPKYIRYLYPKEEKH